MILIIIEDVDWNSLWSTGGSSVSTSIFNFTPTSTPTSITTSCYFLQPFIVLTTVHMTILKRRVATSEYSKRNCNFIFVGHANVLNYTLENLIKLRENQDNIPKTIKE
ncbi:lysosomal-trafficking regulator isoform X3 [Vespula maculifrons]|uniref:Lysosomal-trafficking regulator isoform X3 n=1 Tax=Vespula maculifrons TaxID=7453 RepID=A0ABD2CAT5_VESMC